MNFSNLGCDVAKHANDILFCLYENSSLNSGLDILLNQPSKAPRKAMFKALRTSKKLKYMNNLKLTKKVCITALRDEQLIICRKRMPETKPRITIAAEVEKKNAEKENKVKKKAK